MPRTLWHRDPSMEWLRQATSASNPEQEDWPLNDRFEVTHHIFFSRFKSPSNKIYLKCLHGNTLKSVGMNFA